MQPGPWRRRDRASGFYIGAVASACRQAGVRYSITIKHSPAIRAAIATIADNAWTPIPYFLDGADRAPGQTHPPDHRRHAVVEDAIRDLEYGVGLNHLPSGRFGANAARLNFNVAAHNLARWTSRLGLGETLIATDTLRRQHLRAPARITRSARKHTIRFPAHWPWAE